MNKEQIRELVKQMTLEEKAGLCSGEDFWHTKGIERLGIPSLMLSDGPHGLRKQEEAGDHLGINESIKAVCFPAGCAIASSFSREAAALLGDTLGRECQAEDVSTVLGPAMNIKRSPLCGRNFEYYSEDPLVSSELGTAYVNAVQAHNVGTSPKHFVANNQEFHRMTSDSVIDERTLREIYLASFEGVVKNAKPWTIMNSYNKLNGTYVCEHKEMLTDVLRKEWGFDGYVMTDWGAMNERVDALKAGCNLEMPGNGGTNDVLIVEAVKNGELDEEVLDRSCEEYLDVLYRYIENRDPSAVFDLEKDHQIAKQLAEECIVLLKNDDDILPLGRKAKAAFIGEFAAAPRYQGGGSSHINSFRVESAVDAVTEDMCVTYARGYDAGRDETDEELLAEAVEAACSAEVAVIFAGLPDSFESEGYDRKHMRMPESQNHLIEEVVKVNPNVIVVLHNGSPVEMPWIDNVKGVLEAYLGGQAVGAAVVRVLYGDVNPSGHLAETFPLRLQDAPCYLTYGGEKDRSEYREGVFVGYRYYTSKDMKVLFPFGHGLSYTEFEYSDLHTDREAMKESEKLSVSVDVINTGSCAGKEVVQLYVSPKTAGVIRPARELRAFEKIELAPGEKKTVSFTLDSRAFAYWDTDIHDWYVQTGEYEIQICRNAEEMLLVAAVSVESEKTVPKRYHLNSTLGEIMADPAAGAIFEAAMGGQAAAEYGMDPESAQDEAGGQSSDAAQEAISDEMIAAMMEGMPLRQMISFMPGVTKEMLLQLISALNGEN